MDIEAILLKIVLFYTYLESFNLKFDEDAEKTIYLKEARHKNFEIYFTSIGFTYPFSQHKKKVE